MASPEKARFTPAQYLEWERAAEYRSEYIAGEMFAMSGGSVEHSTIIVNVTIEIGRQLKGKPCRVLSSDMRLNVGAAYFYPDIAVACGKIELLDSHNDTLLNPTVIIEVLSPSTEAFVRGEKFARYWAIESLHDFILISQNRPRIEHFERLPDNSWRLTASDGRETSLDITSIDCTLQLSDVYDRIEFSQSADAQ